MLRKSKKQSVPPYPWQIEAQHPDLFEFYWEVRDEELYPYLSSSVASPCDVITIRQSISAHRYRGKTVKFSVCLEKQTGEVGLCIAAMSYDEKLLARDIQFMEPAQKDSTWMNVTACIQVPDSATRVSFGIFLRGVGIVTFKDLSFTETKGTKNQKGRTLLQKGDNSMQEINLDDFSFKLWPNPTPPPYEWKVDEDPNGSRSLLLKSSRRAGDSSRAFLWQRADVASFRGRKVCFSAKLRAKDLSGRGSLYLLVSGSDTISGKESIQRYDDMTDRHIQGTTDWTDAEITIDIPQSADQMEIGIFIQGTGSLKMAKPSIGISSIEKACTDRSLNLLEHPTNLSFRELEKK